MTKLSKLQKENLREIALIKDDEINYTNMPEWTTAQWARAIRGPDARAILRASAMDRRPAREAFWTAVKPITETEAFKHWFTGSKTVTEDGRPQVLFHKATSGLDEFCCSDGPVGREYGSEFGRGFYFYTNPETAKTYGGPSAQESEDSCSRVLPVYLSTAKPLVLRTGEDLRSLWAGAGGRDAWFAMTPKEKAEHIQGLGYDSVLAHRYGQSVVYHATHIKLAIANNEDLAANLVRDLLPDSA